MKYPNSELGLVCRAPLGQFFLDSGLVDKIFEVDKKDSASLSAVFAATKKFNADIVICPHQSIRSALWVSKLRAPLSVGFYKLWNFWAFKKRVYRDLKKHDVLRQTSLLEPLGIENLTETVLYPKISLDVPNSFKELKSAIALAPGSQWATKKWKTEGFIDLAKQFISEGKKVVLIGTKAEADISAIISAQVPEVISFVGKTTVTELAQLLSQCKILISNDSGAMHVATVVGTPVVAIFGPTVPAQGYAPWSLKAEIVEKKDLACRPCGAHGHHECPIKTHACMKAISSEKVLQAAARLLQ